MISRAATARRQVAGDPVARYGGGRPTTSGLIYGSERNASTSFLVAEKEEGRRGERGSQNLRNREESWSELGGEGSGSRQNTIRASEKRK